jgi:hypothetical protein
VPATPLPQFATSKVCQTRAHCRACRNRASDFRRVMARRYTLPGGMEDFDCPHGRPWGYVPPPAAPRPTPRPATRTVARPEPHDAHILAYRLRVREPVCAACPHFTNWTGPDRLGAFCDLVPNTRCKKGVRWLKMGRCLEWERQRPG